MEKEEKVRQAQERAKEVRTLDIKEIKKRMQKIRKSFDMNQEDFFSVISPEKENAFMENQTGTAETKKQKRPKKASSKQSYISKIENRKSPKIDDLERYAAAGGVSLEWLLYGEEEKKEEKPTTLRDFCRVVADTWEQLNISVEIPNDTEDKISGQTEYCTIKIPLVDYYYSSDDVKYLSLRQYPYGSIVGKALNMISKEYDSYNSFTKTLYERDRKNPYYLESLKNSVIRHHDAIRDILELVPEVTPFGKPAKW